MIVFGTGLISALAAEEARERELQEGLEDAMTRRRLYYGARELEGSFWRMLKRAVKEGGDVAEVVNDWTEREGGGTGWLDADGQLHKGEVPAGNFLELLPNKLVILKRYPASGRDVIFVPVMKDGFMTYALMASGEWIEIPS